MKEILLSAAISLDGFLDDDRSERLLLSSEEDFAAVRAERSRCDAILVGAETIRRDNPSLRASGDQPRRVTVTRSGEIPRDSRFFDGEDRRSLVLTPRDSLERVRARLGEGADVVAVDRDGPAGIISALEGVGIERLMVEGGTSVLTAFLSIGCFTRLRLSVAPFFAGATGRARFVHPDVFTHNKDRRLHLRGVRTLGNNAVLEIENVDAAS